ncbi:MAG: DUF1592 domain-containing protein [Bythopirellula sp.]
MYKSVLPFAAVACLAAVATAAPVRSLDRFESVIKPFVQQHCLQCHGPEKQEGQMRLDSLSYDLLKGANRENWHEVLSALQKGDMPPEEAKNRPAEKELDVVVELLQDVFNEVLAATESTGGRVVLRRLTKYEYQNTMTDLLGIDYDFTNGLPADEKSRDGFRNNGSTMEMTTAQLLHYMETARDGLQRAIVTGEEPREMVSKSIVSSNKTRLKLYPVTTNALPKPKGRKSKATTTETTTSAQRNTTDIQPGEFFPFREGVLRVRVKVRALNDKVQLLAVATGKEGDKVNELKLIDEVEFRGKESQEFVFDVQMADYPKPVYAVHKGAKVHLLVQAWDANQIRFEQTFGMYKGIPTSRNFVIESLEVEGPIVEQWPPNSHTRVFIPSANSANEEVYAREVISHFMRRAWRRPITKGELAESLAQYQAGRDDLEFVPAIRETLVSVLTSPNFLFLAESARDAKTKVPLADHELATRLSYFLWSTMPDENLSRLADSGQLRDSKLLGGTVTTMIKDDRAKNFVEHFALQWLSLDLVESVAVHPEYYPDYDLRITQDMRQETLLLFEEILKKNLSILNFIDADFTYLNRRLAKHYGIPFPPNEELGFVRVSLRDVQHRGGVLTHGSVHLAGSNGEDSHAIRRGAWVLDRLLASPPPTPPADVPQLDSSNPELANLSLKQQLALHVKNEACARCHKKIDPFGVAFEHYDATGAWRGAKIVLVSTEKNGANVSSNRKKLKKNKPKPPAKHSTVPVDATTQLHDGTVIDGIPGLKTYLLTKKKDQFVEGFVRRLLAYALGRSLELGDRPTVERLTAQFHKDGYKLSNLIESIVVSDLFQNK